MGVDPRRRTLGKQLGLDQVRTQGGTGVGAGLGPIVARLGSTMRDSASKSVRQATNVPAQGIYNTAADLSVSGGIDWDEIPAGHLWGVTVIGAWSDLVSGPLFSSRITAIPTGLTPSYDGKVLSRSAVGSREHAWTFFTFGPVTIAAASGETYPGDPAPGGTFDAIVEAVWIRAAITADGLEA